MEFKHQPIMLNEVIEGLNIKQNGVYLDCTLGGAGHSSIILKHLSSKGLLIGIDKDEEALNVSNQRLSKISNSFKLVKSDFNDIQNVFNDLNIDGIDGVLIDLGVSSYQIDNVDRGFTYRENAKLDMRMDKQQEFSAYELVNNYSLLELTKIFRDYGEEKFAYQIANNIVKARLLKPIETTFELKALIERAYPKKILYLGGSVCKKVFQAIRIEVNGELNRLENTLNYLISKLNKGGRICVISFHSLEDRIVKNVFKLCSTDCICPKEALICVCNHKANIKLINKHPLIASEQEIKENTRSTSAKLRIAEKI